MKPKQQDSGFLLPGDELLEEGGGYGDMGGIFSDAQEIHGDGVTLRIPALHGRGSGDMDGWDERRWSRLRPRWK